MSQTLALIHTSPVLVQAFTALCRRVLPEVTAFHMVDESLIRNTISAGRLQKATVRRLVSQIDSAFQAGADAVLVTCSSIGPGVEAARPLFEAPVLRVDEAMAQKAIEAGERIGVLATLRTTLDPTVQLLRDTAARAGTAREIQACLCDGAFEAILAGDTSTHDRLVLEQLSGLMRRSDVVVLAQASMARVVDNLPSGERLTPIFASPELAILQARDVLSALSRAS